MPPKTVSHPFGDLPMTMVSCSTWSAMQSTHLFPLTMALLPWCSAYTGRAFVQLLTCQLKENIQRNVLF